MTYQPYHHYNEDMEKSVIGVMLLEKERLIEVFGLLEDEYFHLDINKKIFVLIKKMWDEGKDIDLITVTHHAMLSGFKNLSGSIQSYLPECMMGVVSGAHVMTWALSMRECYIRKKAFELRMTAVESSEIDAVEFAQATNESIQKALSVQGQDDWSDISQVMIKLNQHMDKVRGVEFSGVHSGFTDLDLITGGFQPTQFILIAARPAVGKSAFAACLSLNAARLGSKVGIISLEMPEEQIGGRMAAIYSGVEFWRVYRANFYDAREEQILHTKISEMSGLPIYFSDKTNVNAGAIRAKALKLKNRCGLDLLIIDYLQLIETKSNKNSNREREVAELSRSLKLLAMELNIPIIVLAQLNRDSEKGGGKPKASQLRESGALEQDADMVLILHRDWVSGTTINQEGYSTENEADLIIAKHRNGETGERKLHFSPSTMKFTDLQKTSSITPF